jgi:predicted HicB family RNase H-like nuclease
MESTQTYAHVSQPMTTPPTQPEPQVPGVKRQEVHRIASELYKQQPDWVTFFRKVLGVDGIARQLFTTAQEMTVLEQSGEYAEIQQMLAKLRERGGSPPDASEPTRVITVRLPKSLHESLRTEAHEKRTSMNKLCISKLLQMVDGQLIPSD